MMPRQLNPGWYLASVLGVFAVCGLIATLSQSRKTQLLSSDANPFGGKARFTVLNFAGTRDIRGQGVYNIPVENHGGGWDLTDYPEMEDDQELNDPKKQVEDTYRPLSGLDAADPRPPLDGGVEDQADYADFYRAYSAYQLPHEVSNMGPGNPSRPRGAAVGFTEDGYVLPRHGLPYSRPYRFPAQPRVAVTLNAGGEGSVNSFRLSGPAIINVTLGGGGGWPAAAAAAAQGAADGEREAPPQPKPAKDSDWGSPEARQKLQPCPAEASGPLPWLSVTPETAMCAEAAGGPSEHDFWQDAYDDAYY